MLARISGEEEKYDEAIRAYERFIAARPKDRWVYAEMAGIYRAQGKFQELARIYAQARAMAPDSVDPYIQESYAHMDLKEYETAEKLLTRALDRHPADREAYHHLGVLCFRRGDMAKAETYFKKAVALTGPRDEAKLLHSYDWLARVYESQTKMIQAEQVRQTAFRIARPGGSQWLSLGSDLIADYSRSHEIRRARALSEKILDFCKTSRCDRYGMVFAVPRRMGSEPREPFKSKRACRRGA